jgi:tRNA (adenine22-N1)-methyltransferase
MNIRFQQPPQGTAAEKNVPKAQNLRVPALGARLSAVAGAVRPGVTVADVGTDHAYLAVYLVNSGKNPLVTACDLRRGPLVRAQATVSACGAGDRVKLVRCDGLAGIAYADDVVIAGMGGELIANILAPCAFIKDPGVSLVLQPMTSAPELRDYLCLAGFAIKCERAAREGDKLYIIMTASYTGNTFRPDALFRMTGLLAKDPGENEKAVLLREAGKLRKAAAGLRQSVSRAAEADGKEKLARQIEALAQ